MPLPVYAEPCGSEPARESGGSGKNVLTDTTSSRAGSLPQIAILLNGDAPANKQTAQQFRSSRC
ncbi:hypothetical protein E5170_16345 [Pseudomonas atacamensis]|uniref:Uncharacterized protein n=1 Tax=Pseudomonas atacamensis TaxID=2565368 RepID=A0AAQ2I0P3_9PSED|nr:hypothetical protein E5170_16345 [Pseudomonas atacamensis]